MDRQIGLRVSKASFSSSRQTSHSLFPWIDFLLTVLWEEVPGRPFSLRSFNRFEFLIRNRFEMNSKSSLLLLVLTIFRVNCELDDPHGDLQRIPNDGKVIIKKSEGQVWVTFQFTIKRLCTRTNNGTRIIVRRTYTVFVWSNALFQDR